MTEPASAKVLFIIDVHVRKGHGVPAYSIFEGMTAGGLTVSEKLTELGVTAVDVAGIATDYCVRASALDALTDGRRVRVLTDLIAGVADAPGRPGASVTCGRHQARYTCVPSLKPASSGRV